MIILLSSRGSSYIGHNRSHVLYSDLNPETEKCRPRMWVKQTRVVPDLPGIFRRSIQVARSSTLGGANMYQTEPRIDMDIGRHVN
jgi:hypothetical protein